MDLTQFLPRNTSDWVQVAVIFLAIFGLLRLARGTIAGSILRGAILSLAGVAVALFFVLDLFAFDVLKLLLQRLVALAGIALIIVFQPELRRGLLALGEHKLFDRYRARPRTCIDALSRAVSNLARERHGALFAIEQRAALHHIVETGVPVDALATSELLANIFWYGAPLHDGGVVLRQDRIVAAACIFPLAERRDLSSRFGTRHRAAIGMSEESDAVVVAVSEETGRVSVVIEGDLRVIDPPSDLARVLTEHMAQIGAARKERELAASQDPITEEDGPETMDADMPPDARDEEAA